MNGNEVFQITMKILHIECRTTLWTRQTQKKSKEAWMNLFASLQILTKEKKTFENEHWTHAPATKMQTPQGYTACSVACKRVWVRVVPKVVYPKYYTYWLYILAYPIDCVYFWSWKVHFKADSPIDSKLAKIQLSFEFLWYLG